MRAFWEDAAVDHGTSSEWGVRYRLTRGLENFALRRVDAITTICEGLRNDMIGRGIAPEKITTIPNAVDIEKFAASRPANESLKEQFGLKSKRIIGFIGSFMLTRGWIYCYGLCRSCCCSILICVYCWSVAGHRMGSCGNLPASLVSGIKSFYRPCPTR